MTVNFGGLTNPYQAQNLMDMPVLNAYSGLTTGAGAGVAGMGYGYGYGMGMMNPQYMMQNMQQWDNFGVSRQVAAYQNQNNAQFQMAGQTENISRQIQILNQEIKADNQDNVKAEYDKLLAAVKTAYGSQIAAGTSPEDAEAQIRAYAERLYTQQTGSYITDDIKNNSSGSFWAGVKQILTFGFGNKTTASDNISRISGVKQTTGDKATKITGNVVGTLIGGALALGSFLLLKGKKA